MAATTLSRAYGKLLSSTMDKRVAKEKPEDMVFGTDPTLSWLMKHDCYTDGTDGVKISGPVRYSKNDTAASVSSMEQVNTAPQDPNTKYFYDRCNYTVQVTETKQNVSMNLAPSKLYDLVGDLKENAELSLQDLINDHIWRLAGLTTAVTGNGGKNIISIPMIVNRSDYTGIDIGGIDMSAETWWAAKGSHATSLTTTTLLRTAIRHQLNEAGKLSGGRPDIAITTQQAFENYVLGLDEKQVYQNNPKSATQDFENVTLCGVPTFWDSHVPDAYTPYDWDNATRLASPAQESIYLLNSKFLKLWYDRNFKFAFSDFQTPHDQPFVITSSCAFVGQLGTTKRCKHAYIGYIATSMTA